MNIQRGGAVLPLLVSFLLSVVVVTAWAGAEPTVLSPVTVVGTVTDPATGMSTLSAEDIQRLPQGDGSLNELLTVMPSVQTSEMSNTSLQGGEILPPNISISGGRFYDNNFMIDGIGNNNLLDPAADDPEAINDLPGRPQNLLLSADLMEEIVVYRSNIPAEFGGFTGGVVDAKTRMPNTELSGSLGLRTTRSNWTKFHLDDEEEGGFRDSTSVESQPRFEKYDSEVQIDLPLSEMSGLLTSYRQIFSEIPLRHFDQTRDQSRQLENYFAKYSHSVSDRTLVLLTFAQTPYGEERFREASGGSEIKNSWYTLKTDSYRIDAEGRHQFDFGEMKIIGAYDTSTTSRNAPVDFFNWRVKPATWGGDWSKDWGTLSQSKEGGYGDLETSQETFAFSASLHLDPLVTGSVTHEIKSGFTFEEITGTYERKDRSYVYTVAYNAKNQALSGVDSSVVCNGDIACVDGEQYANYRTVYAEDSVDERFNSQAIYLQDSLQYRRLTIRPGVRYSTDDFMDNDDVDYRLATTLDLWGTGSTLLTGGANRYHGRALLAYKLAEAKIPASTQKRGKDSVTNTLTPWLPSAQSKSYKKYSTLRTPYSDELTAGVDQSFWGGRLKLNYIERRNKDEFAQETSEKDAGYFTTLNNNGRSNHEDFSVEWERSWENHYVSLNATWQRTHTSNNQYTEQLEEDELSELVFFQDKLMKKIDLPRADYNRAYVGNLIYSATLPYGFAFTNITRYRSGYEALEDSGDEQEGPDGEMVPIFERDKQPESWIFDWRLDWRKDLYRNHGIQLSLEVNNVFDKKVTAGEEEEIQTYELGRQIWAGMEYYF